MTIAEQMKAAASPQDAMLVLATALDRIEAALTQPPSESDAWGTWTAPANDPPTTETLRDQLAVTDDEQERKALEARIRLAEDQGEPIETELPDTGVRPSVDFDVDGTKLTLPAASEEQKIARAEAVDEWGIGQYLSSGRELPARVLRWAYSTAGPFWLYTYDRDAVLRMPIACRQAMVEDVEQDNPREAHNLGRDILMVRSTGDDVATQLDRAAQVG